MATIVNNPGTDSSAGWSAALIILAIIALGVIAFFVFNQRGLSGGGTTQVNVPVSIPASSGGGGTGGTAAGGGSGGSGAGQ